MFLKRVKTLILFCLATTSLALLLYYLDLTSGAFSIAFNFALMFWFAIIEAHLKPSLTSTYFNLYPFENSGKVYRLLGIEWYRTVLVKSGWERMRQQQTPIRKTIEDVLTYERGTRVAELGHLVVGGIVLIVTFYVMFAYSAREAVWLILTNILLNFYPVVLQRYTRPRLARVIELFKNQSLRHSSGSSAS